MDGMKSTRLFPSARLCMFVLSMFYCAILGGGFMAFNFAIVCMVNETAITQSANDNFNHSSLRHGSPIAATRCSNPPSDAARHAPQTVGYNGEFAWDKSTQSNLLAAHAFGAIVVNVPSGILFNRYGLKMIIVVSMLLNAIASALTPVAAYAGPAWVFVVRVIQGLSTGASWPSVLAMMPVWGTPSETGTLIGIGAIGQQLGYLSAMATSSVICASKFRWPAAFYLWSGLSALFLVIWCIFYTDDPKTCRFISKDELSLLQKCSTQKKDTRGSIRCVPWRKILFSSGLLAVNVCQFCSTWATFYVGEFMPTYSKEVLHFEVTANGYTSALPSVCQIVGRIVFGPLSDKLTFGNRSKTFNIKFFTALCTVPPAVFFIMLGFLDCDQTALAVASFSLASFFLAASTSGYSRGGVLMASRYAGLIGGISITYGYLAAIIMPYVVGAMILHGTAEEWKHTSFLAAAVVLASFFQYQAFGSGEQQTWAKDQPGQANKIYVVDTENPIISAL